MVKSRDKSFLLKHEFGMYHEWLANNERVAATMDSPSSRLRIRKRILKLLIFVAVQYFE